MKAPEKIFLHPDIGGREFLRPWLHRPANNESVEYTRTDAFIEKACEWLKLYVLNHDTIDIFEMEDDFKKAMKLWKQRN